ncbi:MAG: polysaccharide biosynthesis/export family protein [Bacteroidota bacterium]|nr:polysaccharide biosynthesis/export family protein [Bacteroidota bacterium]
MLKTPKGFKYSDLPDDSLKSSDYRLSANDILEFSIYSNDGFKLVDLTSLNSSNQAFRFETGLEYLVESDGMVKLPILGRIKINGYTIKEAENHLEEVYSAYYIRPYVVIGVKNKRVIVFPGNPGDAKIIALRNNNTTLIEALAQAGGISENGKARIIKVIRIVNGKHEVYLIDLSKIEGIKYASMVLQANDLIYVEPRRRYATKFFQEVSPIVSLVTSAVILYTYAQLLKR